MRSQRRGANKEEQEREQKSRENEASHQEKNLESEVLLPTAEHSQTLVSVFCFGDTNKDQALRLKRDSIELTTPNLTR